MDAIEIKIGAWLRGIKDGAIYTGQVQAFDGLSVLIQGVWCKEFEPIPLTQEIMEKNSWIRTEHNTLLAFNSEENCYCSLLGFNKFVVKYVHQLQILLNLMGENRELVI